MAELTNSLYGVFISIVLIPECNKVNVTTELLNVKYNFVTVSVLDLVDIVFFIIETLCTEFVFVILRSLMYECTILIINT